MDNDLNQDVVIAFVLHAKEDLGRVIIIIHRKALKRFCAWQQFLSWWLDDLSIWWWWLLLLLLFLIQTKKLLNHWWLFGVWSKCKKKLYQKTHFVLTTYKTKSASTSGRHYRYWWSFFYLWEKRNAPYTMGHYTLFYQRAGFCFVLLFRNELMMSSGNDLNYPTHRLASNQKEKQNFKTSQQQKMCTFNLTR